MNTVRRLCLLWPMTVHGPLLVTNNLRIEYWHSTPKQLPAPLFLALPSNSLYTSNVSEYHWFIPITNGPLSSKGFSWQRSFVLWQWIWAKECLLLRNNNTLKQKLDSTTLTDVEYRSALLSTAIAYYIIVKLILMIKWDWLLSQLHLCHYLVYSRLNQSLIIGRCNK